MKILIFALFSMLLLSACNKQEEMVIFDITVKNIDNSAITEGFVSLTGLKPTISGAVIVYEEELPLSDNGEIHVEISLDSKFSESSISEFFVAYSRDTNLGPSQTVTGCNHEFDSHTCELSDGQRVFDIEIIVL